MRLTATTFKFKFPFDVRPSAHGRCVCVGLQALPLEALAVSLSSGIPLPVAVIDLNRLSPMPLLRITFLGGGVGPGSTAATVSLPAFRRCSRSAARGLASRCCARKLIPQPGNAGGRGPWPTPSRGRAGPGACLAEPPGPSLARAGLYRPSVSAPRESRARG